MNTESRFLCLTGSPGEPAAHLLASNTTVLHAASGTFIHDDGKNLSLVAPTITGVAVADWAAVAGFWHEHNEATWTQHLRFHGGGQARVVRDHLGAIDSFVAEGVNAFASFSGLVILSPYQQAAQPTGVCEFPSALNGHPSCPTA